MNSFIPWVGGKMALRDEILKRFPLVYKLYVEVFGGGASVLFHKQPEAVEIYNDFNNNLVTLFRMVREQPDALIRELDWSLNSRVDFYEILRLFDANAEMPDLRRAANMFKLIKYSYGSKCTSFGCQPCDLTRAFPQLREAHNRLRNVVVENKDFEALVTHYDGRDGAFFYFDPPYFGTEDYYAGVNFTPDNHIRLRNLCGSMNGKFLLSYNDCPEIRELFAGFYIESVTRLSNLAQCYEGGKQYPEVLIANYDMTERSRENEQLSLI